MSVKWGTFFGKVNCAFYQNKRKNNHNHSLFRIMEGQPMQIWRMRNKEALDILILIIFNIPISSGKWWTGVLGNHPVQIPTYCTINAKSRPKIFLKIIRQSLLPIHDNQITRGIAKTPNNFPLLPDPHDANGDSQTLFPGLDGLAWSPIPILHQLHER